jgi:hypothetical protein
MKHYFCLLILCAGFSNGYSQNVGIGTTTPHSSAFLHISIGANYSKGFLINGNTHFTGSVPDLGPGTRLMFYPGKGAFRAGRVTDIQWDNSNVGSFSTALGDNTIASGLSGLATGANTVASGDGSTAMGNYSEASGFYSTAMNYRTTANAYTSTAMGNNTTASGDNSLATGSYTTASGASALAAGDFTSAGGYASFAAGANTISTGSYSTALGYGTLATGEGSIASGFGTTAHSYACVTMGRNNFSSGDPANWVPTDPVLLVGNGADAGNLNNIMEFYKNGNLGIAGNYYMLSDIEFKKDIQPLKNALQKISAVNGYHYYWKSGMADRHLQTGILAQEIQAQMPELVTKTLKGNLMVNYNGLTPYIIEAVKELKNENEQLKNDVEVLKRQMAELLKK